MNTTAAEIWWTGALACFFYSAAITWLITTLFRGFREKRNPGAPIQHIEVTDPKHPQWQTWTDEVNRTVAVVGHFVRVVWPGGRSVDGMLVHDGSTRGVPSRDYQGGEKFGVEVGDFTAWFLSCSIEMVRFPSDAADLRFTVIITLR